MRYKEGKVVYKDRRDAELTEGHGRRKTKEEQRKVRHNIKGRNRRKEERRSVTRKAR